jgi:hypothetical protein
VLFWTFLYGMVHVYWDALLMSSLLCFCTAHTHNPWRWETVMFNKLFIIVSCLYVYIPFIFMF